MKFLHFTTYDFYLIRRAQKNNGLLFFSHSVSLLPKGEHGGSVDLAKFCVVWIGKFTKSRKRWRRSTLVKCWKVWTWWLWCSPTWVGLTWMFYSRQKWLDRRARWWNIQIKVNLTQVGNRDHQSHPVGGAETWIEWWSGLQLKILEPVSRFPTWNGSLMPVAKV